MVFFTGAMEWLASMATSEIYSRLPCMGNSSVEIENDRGRHRFSFGFYAIWSARGPTTALPRFTASTAYSCPPVCFGAECSLRGGSLAEVEASGGVADIASGCSFCRKNAPNDPAKVAKTATE